MSSNKYLRKIKQKLLVLRERMEALLTDTADKKAHCGKCGGKCKKG